MQKRRVCKNIFPFSQFKTLKGKLVMIPVFDTRIMIDRHLSIARSDLSQIKLTERDIIFWLRFFHKKIYSLLLFFRNDEIKLVSMILSLNKELLPGMRCDEHHLYHHLGRCKSRFSFCF